MIVCTQNTKFIRAVNAAMETSKSHEIEKKKKKNHGLLEDPSLTKKISYKIYQNYTKKLPAGLLSPLSHLDFVSDFLKNIFLKEKYLKLKIKT